MIAVIDTSALLRLYIPDGPLPTGLIDIFQEAERGNAVICAPELILAEAAQVLYKKRKQGLLSKDEFRTLLEEILALPIRISSHKTIIERAGELAFDCKISVYDALFLSLAEQKNAKLITADKNLEKAAKKNRK